MLKDNDLRNTFRNSIHFVVRKREELSQIPAHPEEERYAARYTHEHRKTEFLAGRKVIRCALPNITPVLRRNDGAPALPSNVIGSLSHSEEYFAFAYANQAPVGLDIQVPKEVHRDLYRKVVCSDEEKSTPVVQLFSAKEAAYKALSPFHDLIFYPQRVALRPTAEHEFTVALIGGEKPHCSVLVKQWIFEELIISIAGSPL